MKIKRAIERLNQLLEAGETDLIIDWWGKEQFDIETEERWQEFIEKVEEHFSYSETQEDMSKLLNLVGSP